MTARVRYFLKKFPHIDRKTVRPRDPTALRRVGKVAHYRDYQRCLVFGNQSSEVDREYSGPHCIAPEPQRSMLASVEA